MSNEKSNETSSNWKLITILCTIFLSFIAGLIIYLVKCNSMSESDRKTCRIVIWVCVAWNMIVLVGIIVLVAVIPAFIPVVQENVIAIANLI